MRICLYTTITSLSENQPRRRGYVRSLKDSIKRTRDQVRWRLNLDRDFDFNAWSMFTDTNRGDMAIRHAIKGLLTQTFGGDTEFFECGWANLDHKIVDEINRTCDLFVIAGGGYLFIEDDGSLGNRRLAIDNEFFQRISCPKIVYGVGLNQVLMSGMEAPARFGDAASETVRTWLRCFDLVGVRDDATRDVLEQVDGKSIHMIGNPALFLVKEKPSSSYQKKRIGINFAVHGQLAKSLFGQHFDQYHAMLRLLQSQGFSLTYFQHSDTDPVVLRMLRQEGVTCEVADLSPVDLPAAYARMEFVICQMLHSAILATSVGVPSINIAYDRKNFAFYDLFGMSKLCVHHDQFTLEWMQEKIAEVRSGRSSISEALFCTKEKLREKQADFLKLIKDLTISA